ncbi:MAG: TonB-dependent receptor [Thiotrichales bacterium]
MKPIFPSLRAALTIPVVGLISGGTIAAAPPDSPDRLRAIDIVSTTPLHGAGLERDRIATHVEVASDRTLRSQQSLDLSDFMNQRFGSVFLNEAQNNPLQPDLQYRGFTASPLLGLPQGLSAYVDGVRINEPFGDTLNWSVIPKSAIAEINLMSGSNPLFGLNTLGGALSLQTKTGFSHPGAEAEILAGSFGRRAAEASVGGVQNQFGYFITGAYLKEDGWRDFSPTDARQVLGNLSWRKGASAFDAMLSHADTRLIGNGALPQELLDEDREAIFTRPDRTKQQATLFRLGGQRAIGQHLTVEGMAFYRNSDIDTLNGDDSDFEACESAANAGLICESEGDEEEIALDQTGNPIIADESVEGATINRSATRQDTYGLSAQSVFSQPLGGRDNQLIVGIAADHSQSDFNSNTELGRLDDTRRAIGSGTRIDESFTEVEAITKNASVFFTDTWSVTEQLAITLSGRYNRSRVELRDQLGTELNGNHRFSRVNPALGVTYNRAPAAKFYANYAESSRAPTPVELTCADPDAPCRLPNAFLSDPPLAQVVAKTIEAGWRGAHAGIGWHLGAFQTRNHDDIIFISAGALTNQGYFDNVGRTSRRGIELGLHGVALDDKLQWFVNYTRLRATFEDDLRLSSPNNPLAVDGEIAVVRGDRLPGIPENLLKTGITWQTTPRLALGADLQYSSDIFLRGDESNLDQTIDGYTLVDLRGEFRASKRLTFFGKIRNLFDTEYETFGLYGEADDVLGGDDDDYSGRFLSPGAPRGIWVGARYAFR